MQFINRVSNLALRSGSINRATRSYTKTVSVFAQGVTGRLADDEEQATGLRKDELEEELKGHERFNRSMLWTDKIGK